MTIATLPPLPGLASPPTAATSARMAAMPTRDTRPEIALRRAMHAAGLRWKTATGPAVYGRPDVANRQRRVAVFVDGCFWHMCPDHYREPRRNAEWWRAKLLRNVARDLHVGDQLQAAGWLVVRVWEHEDPTTAAQRILRAWREWPR